MASNILQELAATTGRDISQFAKQSEGEAKNLMDNISKLLNPDLAPSSTPGLATGSNNATSISLYGSEPGTSISPALVTHAQKLICGSNLLEVQERAVRGVLACFHEMVKIQTEPIGEFATLEHAAVNSLVMASKTQEMIKHVEDLLKLTRRIRELWVIGPLRPAEGIEIDDDNDTNDTKAAAGVYGGGKSAVEIAEQDRQLMEDVDRYTELRNKLEKLYWDHVVASLPGNGTHEVVDDLDEGTPGQGQLQSNLQHRPAAVPGVVKGGKKEIGVRQETVIRKEASRKA